MILTGGSRSVRSKTCPCAAKININSHTERNFIEFRTSNVIGQQLTACALHPPSIIAKIMDKSTISGTRDSLSCCLIGVFYI
jgi:hypothetical protein